MNQKINTKRSTEAELVAANDVLSHFLSTRNFLKQQRYDCDQKFHQYIRSAILLETNEMDIYSKIMCLCDI